MMQTLPVGIAFIALVGASIVALPQTPVAPTMDIQHWDSVAQDGSFEEQFRVLAWPTPIATTELQVHVDGAAVEARWTRAALEPGTIFAFDKEAFDVPFHLELMVDEAVLWEGRFGSGGGTPIIV